MNPRRNNLIQSSLLNRNTIHSTVQNEAEPSVASTSKRSLEIENDDREKSIAKRAKSDPRILDGTYFEITTRSIDNSNNVKARCTQCGVIRSGSTTGTGNFIRHYTDNHKERYEELLSYIKSNSRILTSSGKTQSTLTMNKVTAERLRELLLNFVVEQNLAFSIVRSPSLKMLLEALSSREIKMPSTSTLISTLANKFEIMKSNLKNELKKQKFVCSTCDVWTHRARSYLGVSVHFIDEQWNRKSFILAFRYLNRRHTYDYLAEILDNIYKEYDLSAEKIIHTITDGGSNFCKAFRIFGQNTDFNQTLEAINENDEIDNDDEIFVVEGSPTIETGDDNEANPEELLVDIDNALIQGDQIDFPEDFNCISDGIALPAHMRCFSHLLNLLGKVDFFNELESYKQTNDYFIGAYSKLKRLWNLTSRSSNVRSIVVEICSSSLKTPGVTRWNSEYDSMCDAYSKRDKINTVLAKLSKDYQSLGVLTTTEWNIVKDYIALMRPIALSLDKLQGEKNVSIGSILPCLHSIKYEITNIEYKTASSNNLKIQAIGKHMQNALLKSFSTRFGAMLDFNISNKVLIVAAVSHPVYKLKWINDDSNALIARSFLEDEMQKERLESEGSNNLDVELIDVDEDEFVVRSDLPCTIRRSSTDSVNNNREFLDFLDDKEKSLCMLKAYPTIAKVFRRFNTTLSSSAPIERLFSQSLIIFTPRRNRISHSNFEKTLLLKQNKNIWI